MAAIWAIMGDEYDIIVIFPKQDTSDCRTRFPLTPISGIERATGRLRFPELTVELSPGLIAQLAASDVMTEAGPVVGLLAHDMSRRATAVGPFTNAREVADWWDKPFNRLAHNMNVVFAVVPVGEASDGRPVSAG